MTPESIPGFILAGMGADHKSLHSGELAGLTGVSPDTIRHYERIGILPKASRTAAGYRKYARDAVERVQPVRRALQLGFTLSELAQILRVRDGGGAPCHRVLHMTEEKLRSLEQQIKELRLTQRHLQQLVRRWRQQLARTAPGSKAMLLHSLVPDSKLTEPCSSDHFKRRRRP